MSDDVTINFGDETLVSSGENTPDEDVETEVPEPTTDQEEPSDEEVLEFAVESGLADIQDELADEEEPSEDYQRFLKLLNEAVPLPPEFPDEEARKAYTETYGRVRTRRVAPNEAYLVRPIRRVDMTTFYRIQQAAAEHGAAEDGSPEYAELWFENELAKVFCVWPTITDEDIEGNGPLALGGTISVIVKDILQISNMSVSDESTFIEDL